MKHKTHGGIQGIFAPKNEFNEVFLYTGKEDWEDVVHFVGKKSIVSFDKPWFEKPSKSNDFYFEIYGNNPNKAACFIVEPGTYIIKSPSGILSTSKEGNFKNTYKKIT